MGATESDTPWEVGLIGITITIAINALLFFLHSLAYFLVFLAFTYIFAS